MADISTSTVRIYNNSGEVIGSGFMISPKIVLTCASLIRVALGLTHSGDTPKQSVFLDFPFVKPDFRLEANVIFWNPEPNRHVLDWKAESATAGLLLKTDPPEGATHTPLLVSEKLLGHPFRALGFPRQFESGVWASGVLLEEVGGNYIQVESFIGGQIQFGFSGAPVWDDKLGGIVGIIESVMQSADKTSKKDYAYLIPSTILIKIWAGLNIAHSKEADHIPPPLKETIFVPTLKKKVKAFLCYADEDKPAVRNLYNKLKSDGVEPWMDEESILVGQDWELEIKKAIRATDVVVICLSNASVLKTGYVQKEIRESLEIAEEKPEGTIFIIPARLDDCDVPERLKPFNWANLFTDTGYGKLIASLKNLEKK